MKIFLDYLTVMRSSIAISLSLIVSNAMAAANYSLLPNNLSEIFPKQTVVSVESHTGTGLIKVNLVGGAKYLVSSDGRYLVKGDILKIEGGVIFDEDILLAQNSIGDHPEDLYITYPSLLTEEIGHVYVISDATCSFCALFHKEVRAINEAGIAVSYIPYASGNSTARAMKVNSAVWCAKDKRAALDYAYMNKGEIAPNTEFRKDCRYEVVNDGYKLGKKLKVRGTPTLFFSDGSVIPGNTPSGVVIAKFKN